MSTTTPDPLVDALQTALAAEHAAVYAYGVVGGRLPLGSSAQVRAQDYYDRHRARRDDLVADVELAGAEAVPAEPAYGLPSDVDTEDQADALGQQVEDRVTVAWSALVALTTGALRRRAVDAVLEGARGTVDWGGRGVELPGLGEA